ncbi:LOW QUALITY PROTEIN: hypothetical protein PanWU01x14_279170 [Parasponia andersonii]|uniref:Uncharacterized protein n=1 Tax=Parasponia andersonii TaxID=3476 RepID=A0A2P5B200_PARAD|nr:LOW QUALITY PROTEIN: hypothetical protein PanWU01x14_279170 [Parasponia andersonii]
MQIQPTLVRMTSNIISTCFAKKNLRIVIQDTVRQSPKRCSLPMVDTPSRHGIRPRKMMTAAAV